MAEPLFITPQQLAATCRETVLLFKQAGLPFLKAALVGSAAILPEPALAKDIDILFLLPDGCDIRPTVLPFITPEHTWGYDEGTYPLDEFESLRYKNLNLLFVSDPEVYRKWLLSAKVCRALALTKREDRVMVHQIIMDDLYIPVTFPFSENLELLDDHTESFD